MWLDAVRTHDGCGVTATYAEGLKEAIEKALERRRMAIETAPKWRSKQRRDGAPASAEMAPQPVPRWRPSQCRDGAPASAEMAPQPAPRWRPSQRRDGAPASAEMAPQTPPETAPNTVSRWRLKPRRDDAPNQYLEGTPKPRYSTFPCATLRYFTLK